MIYDNNAEQSILGAILINNNILDELDLKPEDFYNKFHIDIFNTIKDLRNNNTPADLVTIADKLPDSVEYVSNLMMCVPTTSNAKHYARMIKGKSIRRQVIRAAEEVIDMAVNGIYENITTFQNDVMQKLDFKVEDKHKSKIQDIAIRALELIDERYNRKTDYNLAYGLPWLDKKTGGAHNSELTILAARPSVGKTALAQQFAYHVATKDNTIAIFNLEMSADQLIERWISHLSKIPVHDLRYAKSLKDSDFTSINEAVSHMIKKNIFIYDTVFRVEEIRSICRGLKKLDYVVIDYLQLMESGVKGNKNDQVSHMSRQLKLMAKEFNIPILVLSQLSRANDKDKREPRLSDLRDSGSIEQDADNVMFLHDSNYGEYALDETSLREIKLIIAKQRNGQRDIYCDLGFRANTQTFTEVTNENERVSQTKQSGKSEGLQKDNKGRGYY